MFVAFFFFSSRRRHTRLQGDWSSDVCSSDLHVATHRRADRRRVPLPPVAVPRAPEASVTAGSIDIPPRGPVPLAGFTDRTGPSRGVADPLELNALLLRTPHTSVAILSADLLFVTEDLKRRVAAAVRDHVTLSDVSFLFAASRSEEHTSELQSPCNLVCRLLLEKKKKKQN